MTPRDEAAEALYRAIHEAALEVRLPAKLRDLAEAFALVGGGRGHAGTETKQRSGRAVTM